MTNGPLDGPEADVERDDDDLAEDGAEAALAGEELADDTLAGEEPEAAEAVKVVTAAPRGRRRLERSGEYQDVYSGQAMTSQEASVLLAERGVDVVVLLGDVDVGKTTLLASIYECIASGPVGGWQFAGSRSLIGFESRTFLATAASGRSHEDTPRTSTSTEQILLHVVLRNESETRHLLLADVSGEHARAMRLYDDSGAYGPLLKSATRALVLVDGEMLVRVKDQNVALAEAATLVRAIAQGGEFRIDTPLDIVVTKWDLCADADGLDEELDRLLAVAKDAWSAATLLRTAARPRAVGLEDLLTLLLSPRKIRNLPKPFRPESGRIAHRFTAHAGKLARLIATGSRR